MTLRLTALVKQVPKGDHSGRLDVDGRLERAGAITEMNPWCRRAVAQAVRLAGETGGRSTAITMGPPAAVDVLREALAWGVDDAVLLTDPALAQRLAEGIGDQDDRYVPPYNDPDVDAVGGGGLISGVAAVSCGGNISSATLVSALG